MRVRTGQPSSAPARPASPNCLNGTQGADAARAHGTRQGDTENGTHRKPTHSRVDRLARAAPARDAHQTRVLGTDVSSRNSITFDR
jgi:hypothetical protein